MKKEINKDEFQYYNKKNQRIEVLNKPMIELNQTASLSVQDSLGKKVWQSLLFLICFKSSSYHLLLVNGINWILVLVIITFIPYFTRLFKVRPVENNVKNDPHEVKLLNDCN